MLRLGSGRGSDYRDYLREQLDRTLRKRENDPGHGARALIDEVARAEPASAAVLCIGCRNGHELDEFRARGFADVVGIDIFSQRSDIVVMDMHELAFPDDSFDVVYSSHSLEHAYDVDGVVAQIARVGRDGAVVAVEVPVRHHGSDADRVDFDGLDALREPFRRYVREELLAVEDVVGSDTNDQGSDVARLVFRLRKGGVSADP